MAAYFQTTPVRTVLQQNELHFRLYLHHTYGGANRNQIHVVSTGAPNGFGNIIVNDWAIYDGAGPDAKIVARAQGQRIHSSMSSREWHNNFTIVFGDEGVIPHTVEIEPGDEDLDDTQATPLETKDEELNTVGDGAHAVSRFKGSTLQVMGTLIVKGEWAIVGGTGEFTMAQGVIYKTIQKTDSNGDIIQLDIHALYTPMKRSKVSGSAAGNAWTLGV